uniref:Cytochrome c oxidase subunit 2 n=2 Tax=Vesicomyidae TaxID=6588 RepID=A0A2P1DMG0_9BIVA|nr:cytochrome c oxidase subunit II [Archivesica sp. 2 Sanya-2018]BBA25637.1 cytochrome c oxidase subunit II [Calyptogena pacifica]
MGSWEKMWFYDMNTVVGQELILYNDLVMTVAVAVLAVVGWFMLLFLNSRALFGGKMNKYVYHNELLEIMWTMVPAFMLCFLGYVSLMNLYIMEVGDHVVNGVKVTAHQWYWEYSYVVDFAGKKKGGDEFWLGNWIGRIVSGFNWNLNWDSLSGLQKSYINTFMTYMEENNKSLGIEGKDSVAEGGSGSEISSSDDGAVDLGLNVEDVKSTYYKELHVMSDVTQGGSDYDCNDKGMDGVSTGNWRPGMEESNSFFSGQLDGVSFNLDGLGYLMSGWDWEGYMVENCFWGSEMDNGGVGSMLSFFWKGVDNSESWSGWWGKFSSWIPHIFLSCKWNYSYEVYEVFNSLFLSLGSFRGFTLTDACYLMSAVKNELLISTMDVMHSWGVGSLGVKCDAVPGRVNSLGISPLRSGVFYGNCYELCGEGHSMMPISVAVMTPNDVSLVLKKGVLLTSDCVSTLEEVVPKV